jgi:hypothetical protein
MATYEEMKKAHDTFAKYIYKQREAHEKVEIAQAEERKLAKEADDHITELLLDCGWEWDDNIGWQHKEIPNFHSHYCDSAIDRQWKYYEELSKNQPLISCDLIFRQDDDWWKCKDYTNQDLIWKYYYLVNNGWYVCNYCILDCGGAHSGWINWKHKSAGNMKTIYTTRESMAIQKKWDSCPEATCLGGK